MLPNLDGSRDSTISCPLSHTWTGGDFANLPEASREELIGSNRKEPEVERGLKKRLTPRANCALNPLDFRRRSADNRSPSSTLSAGIHQPSSSSKGGRLTPRDKASQRNSGSRSPPLPHGGALETACQSGIRGPATGGFLITPSASRSSSIENPRPGCRLVELPGAGSFEPRPPSPSSKVENPGPPGSRGSRSPPTPRGFAFYRDVETGQFRRRSSLGQEMEELVAGNRGNSIRPPCSSESCNDARIALPSPSTISTTVGCSSTEASPRLSPSHAWESVPDSGGPKQLGPTSTQQSSGSKSLWERRKESVLVVQTDPNGAEARNNARLHTTREIRRPPSVLTRPFDGGQRRVQSCNDMQAMKANADEEASNETESDHPGSEPATARLRTDRISPIHRNAEEDARHVSTEERRPSLIQLLRERSPSKNCTEVPVPPTMPRSNASPRPSPGASQCSSPQPPSSPPPSAGYETSRHLALVGNWEFDALGTEADSGHVLQQVGRRVLETSDCVSRPALLDLLHQLEGRYHTENPYHSHIHAADMCNAFLCLTQTIGIWRSLAPHVRAMSLLAALGHDVAHPARTNIFLVRTEHEYPSIYGEQSVLEHMHAATLMRLIDNLSDETSATQGRKSVSGGIFPALTSEELSKGRHLMTMLVVQTDASKHSQALNAFRKRLQSEPSEEGDGRIFDPAENDDDQQQCLSMIFRAADLGHSAKRWELHEQWSARITQEFHAQGDEEKRLGLPVSPLCEREGFVMPREQTLFLQFVCVPTWLELANCEAYLHRTRGQVLWDSALSQVREKITNSPLPGRGRGSWDEEKAQISEVWMACKSAVRKRTGDNSSNHRRQPALEDLCYKRCEGNRQRWKSMLDKLTPDAESSKDAQAVVKKSVDAVATAAEIASTNPTALTKSSADVLATAANTASATP